MQRRRKLVRERFTIFLSFLLKTGRKKAPPKVLSRQEYLINVLINAKNSLCMPKLSTISAERCTFDRQFPYFIPALSVILHGKPSFPESFLFVNEYMVTR